MGFLVWLGRTAIGVLILLVCIFFSNLFGAEWIKALGIFALIGFFIYGFIQ